MSKMLVLATLVLVIPGSLGCNGTGVGASLNSDSLTPSLNFTGPPPQSEPDVSELE